MPRRPHTATAPNTALLAINPFSSSFERNKRAYGLYSLPPWRPSLPTSLASSPTRLVPRHAPLQAHHTLTLTLAMDSDLFDEIMNTDAMAVDGPERHSYHEANTYSTCFDTDCNVSHGAHAAFRQGADLHATLASTAEPSQAFDFVYSRTSFDAGSQLPDDTDAFFRDMSPFHFESGTFSDFFPPVLPAAVNEQPFTTSVQPSLASSEPPAPTVAPCAVQSPAVVLKAEEEASCPIPAPTPASQPLPTPPRSRQASPKKSPSPERVTRKLPARKTASKSPSPRARLIKPSTPPMDDVKPLPSPPQTVISLPSPTPSVKRQHSEVEPGCAGDYESDDEDDYRQDDSDSDDDDFFEPAPRTRKAKASKKSTTSKKSPSRSSSTTSRASSSKKATSAKKPRRRRNASSTEPIYRGRPPKAGRPFDPRPAKKQCHSCKVLPSEQVIALAARESYKPAPERRFYCPVAGCGTLGRSADVRRHLLNLHMERSLDALYAVTDNRYRQWCLACRTMLAREDARERHEWTCRSWNMKVHGKPTRKQPKV
ncbi:hypothetical protein BD626DRAFT_482616 [Schizophyllum amplum]|uniref:Uncharacterized protein n=1 Tax=Schizophyllum amplum TaxID=97359 RepID=A0A550CVC8_9AGAR|nr:hypothetical protein BD626DRAFT_482616 [Auriculariopsis ampla]